VLSGSKVIADDLNWPSGFLISSLATHGGCWKLNALRFHQFARSTDDRCLVEVHFNAKAVRSAILPNSYWGLAAQFAIYSILILVGVSAMLLWISRGGQFARDPRRAVMFSGNSAAIVALVFFVRSSIPALSRTATG
jgi:hypothetical protein